MSTTPPDAENREPDLVPELRGIADRLRREAQELAECYPADEAKPKSNERPTVWRGAIERRHMATAATVLLLVTGVIAVDFARTSLPSDGSGGEVRISTDDDSRAVPAQPNTTVPHSWQRLPHTGLHEMSGPELEAVLNLLEENATPFKLAL